MRVRLRPLDRRRGARLTEPLEESSRLYLPQWPNSPLIAELTPSTTPFAPSTPLRPRVPSSSATFLMLTPSWPAIDVAIRVDRLSLSEKFGLLVSPLRVKSTSMVL